MGLVTMSEHELNRIEVLSEVTQGRMTVVAAAHVLGLSRRQAQRLIKTFRSDGVAAKHIAKWLGRTRQAKFAVRAVNLWVKVSRLPQIHRCSRDISDFICWVTFIGIR